MLSSSRAYLSVCDPVSCSIFLMKCRGHPSTSVLGHCLHLFNDLATFHSSAEASSTPSGEGPEYFLAIRKAAAMSFQGVLDRGTLGPWGQSLFVWFAVMSLEPNHTEHSVKKCAEWMNKWHVSSLFFIIILSTKNSNIFASFQFSLFSCIFLLCCIAEELLSKNQ